MFSGRGLVALLLLGLGLASGDPAQTPTQTGQQVPPKQQLPQPIVPQQAAWLALRNDTTVPLLVRTEGLAPNGQPWAGGARLINPREASWEPLPCLGQKRVTLYDTRGRVLAQETISLTAQSTLYLIQAEAKPDKTSRFYLRFAGDPRLTLPNFPGKK